MDPYLTTFSKHLEEVMKVKHRLTDCIVKVDDKDETDRYRITVYALVDLSSFSFVASREELTPYALYEVVDSKIMESAVADIPEAKRVLEEDPPRYTAREGKITPEVMAWAEKVAKEEGLA